tara:strand:- start:108 stop:437 length:330 start_codon:yes stop_codon:yes gene_type:complete
MPSLFKKGIAHLKMGTTDLVGGTLEFASKFAHDVEHEVQSMKEEKLKIKEDTLAEKISLLEDKIALCKHCKATGYQSDRINWDEDIAFLEMELQQLKNEREPQQMDLPL